MQPSLPETACHGHPQHNRRILRLSFLLISGFMLLEFLGGYFFHSLALMADAGHMANDSLALALAWLAQFLGTRNRQRLALASGGSLIILALWIIVVSTRTDTVLARLAVLSVLSSARRLVSVLFETTISSPPCCACAPRHCRLRCRCWRWLRRGSPPTSSSPA